MVTLVCVRVEYMHTIIRPVFICKDRVASNNMYALRVQLTCRQLATNNQLASGQIDTNCNWKLVILVLTTISKTVVVNGQPYPCSKAPRRYAMGIYRPEVVVRFYGGSIGVDENH